MFFHKPSMTSTYDISESVATPRLKRIWTMIRHGLCWLHRCMYRKEKQVLFIFFYEKIQCPVHLTHKKNAGNSAALLSLKRKSSQGTLSNREGISSGHQPVQRKGEIFFRFSDPEKAGRLVLEEKKRSPTHRRKI